MADTDMADTDMADTLDRDDCGRGCASQTAVTGQQPRAVAGGTGCGPSRFCPSACRRCSAPQCVLIDPSLDRPLLPVQRIDYASPATLGSREPGWSATNASMAPSSEIPAPSCSIPGASQLAPLADRAALRSRGDTGEPAHRCPRVRRTSHGRAHAQGFRPLEQFLVPEQRPGDDPIVPSDWLYQGSGFTYLSRIFFTEAVGRRAGIWLGLADPGSAHGRLCSVVPRRDPAMPAAQRPTGDRAGPSRFRPSMRSSLTSLHCRPTTR